MLIWLLVKPYVPFYFNPVSLIELFLLSKVSPGSQHGNTDINASFAPDSNRYLVVHEYSGFEPGDAQSLQTIRRFISNHTNASCPVSERLHAIW